MGSPQTGTAGMSAHTLRHVLVAITALLMIAGGLIVASPSARADDLASLTLVNANATGGSVSLQAQSTPRLFTGNANAADDTINVLATFSSGTASVSVAVGSGPESDPVPVLSGVETPVPLVSGTNNIYVTHVGATTTTYTMRIHRGIRITGYEVINADDSAVIASRTYTDADIADQQDSVPVPYGTYRIRARMFYDTPTEPSANPVEGLIWTGCVGCSFNTVTSGQWTPVTTLNAGQNNVAFYPTVAPWSNYWGTSWNLRITRAPAFDDTTVQSLALRDGNATGGSVNLSAQSTPYLFTGNGNAADDSINVIAEFTTGTASVTVALGAGAESAPQPLTSGVGTAVPLRAGTNNIYVTHVGDTTTRYTMRVHRGPQITGYEVINADDSTVIASRTYTDADIADQQDEVSVPYGTYRIRARMFYDTPTEPSANPVEGLIWTGCVGCSFNTVTSGQWTPVTTLNAGQNNVAFYPTVAPWSNYWGTSWNLRITRAPAFNADVLESLSIASGNVTETAVALQAQSTPFLYTGNASAVDDTLNVLATFTNGTATARVALGAGSFTSPVPVTSGVPAPLPISAGTNNIEVTHVGATTTTYTLRIHRGPRITGFEIINADDSAVLISRTGANFDYTDQLESLVFPHDVYRLRARMFYDTPTEPTASPVQGLIWTGCVGCSFNMAASGEWTSTLTFNVGVSEVNFYPTVEPWWNYWGTAWTVRVTRASAFASISNVTLPGVPPVGTSVSAGTTLTAAPVGLDGVPTPTVTYDWEATESLVDPDWELVETTTSPTWTPDNDVANQYVRVTATADNGVSTPVSRTSDPVGPIAEADEAPRFRQGASITGVAEVGASLTASTGRVTGRPTPTVSYEWQVADDSESSFASISGATGATYVPTPADEGKIIRAVMRANNGIGSEAVVTTSGAGPIQARSSSGGGNSPSAEHDAPSAPRDVHALPGSRSATVTWQMPITRGTTSITTYEVTSSPGSRICLTEAPGLTCEMTGLTNGTSYTFRVRALNGAGWGAYSVPSTAVTPKADPQPTMLITGSRTQEGKGRRIVVEGVTTGMVGMRVTPHFRFAGRGAYRTGVLTPRVSEQGTFRWRRSTSRKVHVYFANGSVRSNKVVIAAR